MSRLVQPSPGQSAPRLVSGGNITDVEGRLMSDHVQALRFPQTPGRFGDRVPEGKSAIAIAPLCGKERNFTGEHFWARSYAVSTVGSGLSRSTNTSASKSTRMGSVGSSEWLS
jgi:hypothetical protein